MNTQKQAMSKIAQIQKEELSAEKVELSLISDFDIAFDRAKKTLMDTEPTYRDILSKSRTLFKEIDSVISDIEKAQKFYSVLEKGAKDLGVQLDSSVSGKATSLVNYIKTANQIKNELKAIV
jgi:hypothetical protein